MSFLYRSDYNAKKRKKEEILSLIKPSDRILAYGGCATFLTLLDEHYRELTDLSLFTMFMLTREYQFLNQTTRGHINHYATFVSPMVRRALAEGQAPEILLTHYSDTDDFVRYRARPTVLFAQATPMDEEGYFTMGFNSLGHRTAADMAERIIVQVNRKLPRILGDCNRLHVSEVSALFEEDAPIHTAPVRPFDEVDLQAARFVAERIPDGATMQIGVGRTPDAVGSLLYGHKDLGIHTELLSMSLMKLMKAGVINNSQKTFLPDKAVFAFAGGVRATQEIYDFVHNNEDTVMYPISWVNDPRVIAKHDRFISVNSALSVDLTGQACSETIGLRTFSGPGGQLDFVRGARWSKGGHSYIILNSVTEGEDGEKISKIDLVLPPGSAVTTPRTDIENVVTEYGVAELRFKSLGERARALIAVAHPQFREELAFKARKTGYFI